MANGWRDQATDDLERLLATLAAEEVVAGTLLAPGQVISDPDRWRANVRDRADWTFTCAGRPRSVLATADLIFEIGAATGQAVPDYRPQALAYLAQQRALRRLSPLPVKFPRGE